VSGLLANNGLLTNLFLTYLFLPYKRLTTNYLNLYLDWLLRRSLLGPIIII
jgi:hypothetical protein